MAVVKLSSQEGEEFEVPVDIAKLSETVKHIMEDIGHDQIIPLPNVTGKILQKVIDYCRYHVDHPAGADGDKKDDGAFDKEFVKVDQPMLFDLILAANYLDIRPLLDLTCKTVADMIKGKTMDEIRKTFNIKNDFTPEEEEHLKKEIEWVEEK